MLSPLRRVRVLDWALTEFPVPPMVRLVADAVSAQMFPAKVSPVPPETVNVVPFAAVTVSWLA
jgi:hypothetical protein